MRYDFILQINFERFPLSATAAGDFAPTNSLRGLSCISFLQDLISRPSMIVARVSNNVISSIVRRQAKALMWRKPGQGSLAPYSGTDGIVMVGDWDLRRIESLGDGVFAVPR
jgi:hypothetical protein